MRTLVEQLQRNLNRDPRDAPVVDVQGDCDVQDMYWMPEAEEPQPTSRMTMSNPRSG